MKEYIETIDERKPRRKRKRYISGGVCDLDEYRSQELIHFVRQYHHKCEDIEDIETVAKAVVGDQWKGFLAGMSAQAGKLEETLSCHGFTGGKSSFVTIRRSFLKVLDAVRDKRETERSRRSVIGKLSDLNLTRLKDTETNQ